MKRQVLMMTMALAAMTTQAQVVLWNGEDKEVGTDGGFWNRADPTVVEQDGNKCLQVTLKGNPGGWDQEHHNAALPVGDADFKGLRRLTFRLKMTDKHNVMVQLEGKDGAFNAKRIFWYDTPGEWQVMTYEYSVGPDSEKITDNGSNVLAVWPFEETADGEGKTIFIDDIQLEGPMADGMAVRSLADNTLTGDVVITGTIGKGGYQNTWDGDWHGETYDDYALLADKLAPTTTSLDVRGAGRWDEDWSAIEAKCPGIRIIKTDDDVTAISTVTAHRTTGSAYTLSGIRLSQPVSKGIYVVDGKKVVRH